MKRLTVILLIIFILFSFSEGVSRENLVKSAFQNISPMFGYNAQHTRQYPYDTSTNNGTLKWKFKANAHISSSPAIASDGTIYAGSGDYYLYAINPDGTLKWKYQASNKVNASPAIAPDGTIYVGSEDKNIYALNPNGTLKWKYQTGDGVASSPVIGTDGTIYIGSKDDYLYAINPNGTLKWKYQTSNDIFSSPAISADGTIYVGSVDGYLHAINPSGTSKWKYQIGVRIDSSPAVASDGTIYVGSDRGYLYVINSDGTLKWRYQTGAWIDSSPAIAYDGTIYVGSRDGYVYALNLNGTLKWKYKTDGPIGSSPAISSNGTIYIGSNDNYLYAINSDGTLKWKFKTGNHVFPSPAISSDGTVYVGSDDGYLYAIGSSSTNTQSQNCDLFLDNFERTSIGSNWTIIDDPNPSSNSNWYISNGRLVQDSNIYRTDNEYLYFQGTHIVAGNSSWSDYSFSFDLTPTDDDGVGAIVRYQDKNNYYRFIMVSDPTNNGPFRRIDKIVNGTPVTLTSDKGSFVVNKNYKITINVLSNNIEVFIDGVKILSATDDTFRSGKIGFTTYACSAIFDNACVSGSAVTQQPTGCKWTGTWDSTWGKMYLTQTGNIVTGNYEHDNGKINGTINGNNLIGTWAESPTYLPPNDAGDFILTMSSDCKSFTGKWRYGTSGDWKEDWYGTKVSDTVPSQNPK